MSTSQLTEIRLTAADGALLHLEGQYSDRKVLLLHGLEVPDGGHLLHMEQPDLVAAEIRQFHTSTIPLNTNTKET